jgi:hypothetical protein
LGRSEQGIDERRYDRSLGKYCYGAVNHSYYHERQQPELLPMLGEAPQINKSTQGDPPFDFCSLLHRLVRAPALGHSIAKCKQVLFKLLSDHDEKSAILSSGHEHFQFTRQAGEMRSDRMWLKDKLVLFEFNVAD